MLITRLKISKNEYLNTVINYKHLNREPIGSRVEQTLLEQFDNISIYTQFNSSRLFIFN